MAELTYKCDLSGDAAALTWWWDGVPSDDSGPGKDSYYIAVHNNETGELIYDAPGAEDNAHGVPYTAMVPADTEIYMLVMNEAESFSFEHDEVVSCPTPVETVETLPYTGVSDALLPLAMVLVAVGTWLVRKVA